MKGKCDKKLEFLIKENEKLEEEVNNWKRNYWNLEKKVQYNQLMNNDIKYSEENLLQKLKPLQQENLKLQKELESKKNKVLVERNSNIETQLKTEKDKSYPKKKNFQSYFGTYSRIYKP